jgi:hypothetical protein
MTISLANITTITSVPKIIMLAFATIVTFSCQGYLYSFAAIGQQTLCRHFVSFSL